MLPILDQMTMEVILEVYPDYNQIFQEVFVRIRDLPVEDKLRDLRQQHLNALIKIKGVVTKRTNVFPQLKESYYKCSQCGDIKGPIQHNDDANHILG